MSGDKPPTQQNESSRAVEAARAAAYSEGNSKGRGLAQSEPDSRRGLPKVGLVVFAGFLLAAVAVGFFQWSDSSDLVDKATGSSAETSVDDRSPADDSSDSTVGDSSDTTVGDSSDTTVDGDDAAGDGIDPLTGEPYPESIADLSLAELREGNYPRSVSLPGNRLALRGRVATQQRIDDAVALIEQAGGTAVVELEVTPGFPEYEPGRIFLENFVLFEFGSSDLGPEFLPIIEGTLQAFEAIPDLVVTVVGFADSVGKTEANLKLSEERAQAVADYWISKGVSPEKVIVVAGGESGSAESKAESADTQDRRVEFLMDFGS